MAIGVFPVAKLGALLVKQISKPIAKAIKEHAIKSPVFRKYVCMPPAQFYNWCEVKAKMWVLNLGKPVNIPVLNEAMAIELGANLFSEAIVFIIAAGILLSEYNRSVRKEAAKEKARRDEMQAINDGIRDAYLLSDQNAAQIRELIRIVHNLETKIGVPHATETMQQPSPPSEGPPPAVVITPKVKTADCNESGESLLSKSVKFAETVVWGDEESVQRRGILMIALDHIYKDVYRMPVS